jgi:hypothetical protein
MNVAQLRDALNGIEIIYNDAGDSRSCASIEAFTRLLTGVDTLKLEALANLLEGIAILIPRDASGNASTIEEIQALLTRVQGIVAAFGITAADLEKLVQALESSKHVTVDRFTTFVAAQMKQPVEDRYANMLLSAKTDQAAFKKIMALLQTDKAVKKPTAVAIANRYLNEPIGGTYVFKFKTKADAIEAIRIKFIERAQSDSKNSIISKMTGSNRT